MNLAATTLAAIGAAVALAGCAAAADLTAEFASEKTVNMEYAKEVSETLRLDLDNRHDEPVTVTLSVDTDDYYAIATLSETSVSLGIGESRRVTVRFEVAATTSARAADDVGVVVEYDVRGDTSGVFLQSDEVETTVRVVFPVGLDVRLGAPDGVKSGGQLVQGTAATVDVTAREIWGWSSVSVTDVEVECDPPGRGSWRAAYTASATSVPAMRDGQAAVDLGAVSVQIPSGLDAETFRGVRVACTVRLTHAAGTDEDVFHLDPAVPATVAATGPAARVRFVFDTPPFEAPATLTARNVGESDWTGRLVLRGGAPCAATFTSTGTITLRAFSGPVAVPGSLAVEADHPEMECTDGAFVAAAPETGAVDVVYEVLYDAKVETPSSVAAGADGNVSIGVPGRIRVRFDEAYGFADVRMRATVVPASSNAKEPPPAALVVAGEFTVTKGTVTFLDATVTFPPGTPPGCTYRWEATWTPVATRPTLVPLQTTIVATSNVADLERVRAELGVLVSELGLDDTPRVRALLERLDDAGCGLTDAEIEIAARVLQAVPTLTRIKSHTSTAEIPLLRQAASNAAALADLLEGDAAAEELLPALERVRADLRAVVAHEAENVAELPADAEGVDRLVTLALAYEDAGGDPSVVVAARDAKLRDLEARYEAANASLTALFAVPSKAPLGLEVARNRFVNPNPFGWVALDRLEANIAEDTALARSSFGSLGPLGERVEAAHAEALVATDLARRSLLAGAILDAIAAAGVVALVARPTLQYLQDAEDVALGADVLD